MSLPEFATEPWVLLPLTALMLVLIHYQRGLNWYKYRTLHGLKVMLVPHIDRETDFFVIADKRDGRDNPEFLTTVDGTVRGVWEDLLEGGADPHLINSIKRRHFPDGRSQFSDAHAVWLHEDGTQTEAYLFSNDGGTVDVYAHFETGVQDPEGHLSDPQTDGDPRGVVRAVVE